MKSDKQWTVSIFIDGNTGKFTYHSNQHNPSLAVAVATKEMFAKWIATDPRVTRITDVTCQIYQGEEDEESSIPQADGEISG